MPARRTQTQNSSTLSIIVLIGLGVFAVLGYFLYVGRDIKSVKVGPGMLELKTKKHLHHQEVPTTAQAGLTP